MAADASKKRKNDQLASLFGQVSIKKQAKLPFKVVSKQEREKQLKVEEIDFKAEKLKERGPLALLTGVSCHGWHL